jgi:hypothetical protein
MKIRIFWLVTITTVSFSFGQAGTPDKPSKMSDQEAVTLMRVINTAEAELFFRTKSYVSLDRLLEHRSLKSHEAEFELSDETSGTVRGYRLSVIASPDGKHYQAALIPTECQIAWFSDEVAIIYPGRASGCPTQ